MGTQSKAAVRGMAPQIALKLLKGSPLQEQIVASVGPEHMAVLQAAGMLSWIPYSSYAVLVGATHQLMTASDFVSFWQKVTFEGLEHPLLQGALNLSRKMLGLTAHSLIKLSPILWGLLVKECGAPSVQMEGDHQATFRLVPVPSEAQTAFIREVLKIQLSTFFVATRTQGTIDTEFNLARKEIVYRMRWR
jgi:hypothetical protein